MKYFESNHMANDDFDDLQLRLLKVTAAVASNLTYHMVQDDASELGRLIKRIIGE